MCRITGGVRRGEYKPSEADEGENPMKRMTKHPMPEQDPEGQGEELQRSRSGLRCVRGKAGGHALPELQGPAVREGLPR